MPAYNDNHNNNNNSQGANTNHNTPSYRCGITPEMITELRPNEVFVFGSNLKGMHGGGAARVALMRFGAVMGKGVGLQGQSYAIPTMQGPASTIRRYVDDFIEFAKNHPQMHFLVTKIGCGIAGFKPEQIAPLFRKAIYLANVSLPKEFIDYILANPIVPSHVVKKVYGQTRTMVDIICELNQERPFRSSEEALKSLSHYIHLQESDPDSIVWNYTIRTLADLTYHSMTPAGLDVEHLHDLMKDLYTGIYDGLEEIYKFYVVDKTIKMVEMLNEFRCYTDPSQLVDDMRRVGAYADSCGAHPDDWYYSFGSPSGGYVFRFLEMYTSKFWNEFAPKGTLDSDLYKDFMYQRHARGIKKYGLEAVIERNYQSDGPCHPEVFFPYRGGAGPVYVEYKLLDEDMRHTQQRRMVKSCGEGKGPNGLKDNFEFHRIRPLIESDPKYVLLDKGGRFSSWLVPKDDVTLPLYHCFFGKLVFVSDQAKEHAIRKIWKDNPDLFPSRN